MPPLMPPPRPSFSYPSALCPPLVESCFGSEVVECVSSRRRMQSVMDDGVWRAAVPRKHSFSLGFCACVIGLTSWQYCSTPSLVPTQLSVPDGSGAHRPV
ncbi:hypothetical protein EYF80_023161 [Liparis tanakae]|uniref:Uncharacterized protein n=1 Tax=Liparis tanakae TaxID=230148 RepID=A0A4Z2HLK2_9TELE|nr:hypothetical protein EYF80_023161 [Liparis tanakae]